MLYLGDVAGASETERHRANRLGHEAHGDLIPTISYCLYGLADVPVVVSHADVLGTAERRDVSRLESQEAGVKSEIEDFILFSYHEGSVVPKSQEAKAQSMQNVNHAYKLVKINICVENQLMICLPEMMEGKAF